MKIAICDDNKFDRALLSEYILQYAENTMSIVELVEFGCGEELLSAFTKEQFKILFLDIYMTGINGVAVAEKIRETDEECKIIFTTSSLEHKSDGFEVAATHYLVKPITYEQVGKALNRCKKVLNSNARCIELTVNKEIIKIRLKDIYCIEAMRNGAVITTRLETLRVHYSMTSMEELLTDNRFLRCHRGFIINMDHISLMKDDVFIMKNGFTIPIRQSGRKAIRQAFMDYKSHQ